jgi:lysophospholipase L1-like esterase
MKVRLLLLVPILAAVLVAAPSAQATTKHKGPRYYLALGDSLSVGYQPDAQGVGMETNRGYTNDLLALESKRVKRLHLVEVGCPGDTTTSLLTGQGNTASAQKFHCDRKGGSQLKAAIGFLKAHHQAGEVPLITIDIGANDVDACASAGSLAAIATCVTNGEASISQNTPEILNALKKAAPKGTRFVAMNLYDPVLGEYFSSDPNAKTLASLSVPLTQQINGKIQSANSGSGFKTADVADAFQTYNQSPTVPWEGQMLPVDVAYVCAWTWACTTPPVGPNIHANDNGYAVLAQTFFQTAGRLK